MANTASSCLRAAERMETVARDLYADLSVAFSEVPPLRLLFQRLAAEEEQHAMRIRLLERHQGRSAWPREAGDRFRNDCDSMVAEIEVLRREFGALTGPGDANTVLRRLSELEDRFASIHAQDLARFAGPEVQKLFATLALQDAAHRDLIVAAAMPDVA
jgi:hypothetical protein